MQVHELLPLLERNPDSALRIGLPNGELIPDHFHVTEIGRIEKTFIDCGGTRRESISCILQTWTANDFDHRLSAGKLFGIFKLALPLLKSTDIPVEVEYGPEIASQYFLADVVVRTNELYLKLSGKQTDCLAKDKGGIEGCGTPDCCEEPVIQLSTIWS
jgi:hypothetical protein